MRRRSERGVTLVVSMLIVIAMLGTGVAAVWLSSMGSRVAGNLNARQAALNAANAGVQHARQVIAAWWNGAVTCAADPVHPLSCALAGQTNPKDRLATPSVPLSAGAVIYDGASALVAFQYPPGSCTNDPDCAALGSYTVFIRNDLADVNRAMSSANPSLELAKDTNDTVIVRAEGRDSAGSATVVVEAAVTRLAVGTGSSAPSLTFGKDINQFGNNTITGALKF